MAKVQKITLSNGEKRYRVDYYDLDRKRRKERFRTYREATARLGEILQQRETGELRPRAADITFRELTEEFRLARFIENTRFDYANTLDRFLVPALGPRKLRTIKRSDIESLRGFFRDKAVQGKGTTGVRTANKCLTLLKSILKYAVAHGYLARNPADGVKALATPSNEKRIRVDGAVLAPDELQRLFQHCADRWRTRIMTAALTGLREGELLGLTWGDIDWASQRPPRPSGARQRPTHRAQDSLFAPCRTTPISACSRAKTMANQVPSIRAGTRVS